MFSKSALVLALTAALRVAGDASAVAANQAAETALVAKLLLDPLATDRIEDLSTDDEFEFDFFDPNAAATVGAGGHLVLANVASFPAVVGTSSAMAVGFLGPCSQNTPHTHPRATEMQFSVNGTIRTGMITENGGRFIMTELPPGSMTIFPVGSIHFQVNDGCEPLIFVSTFNSEDPGTLQAAQRFFGLPPDIVGATLGDIGVEVVADLADQIPDNVALGTDACLARCGLKRTSQPTLQQQPRVSGNALPSGSASYSYTLPSATATYSYSSSAPSASASSAPVNHVIKVGIDGLSYTPSNISANIGDTVTFEFHPKNHTVTQSSFQEPCKKLAETSTTGQVGFESGFVPVSETVTVFPTFNITINDTQPIWGYCGQQGPPVHCQQGMVFSINAPLTGNTFEAFQKLANDSGSTSSNTYSSGTTYGVSQGTTYGYGGTTSYGYGGTTYTYNSVSAASAYSMASAMASQLMGGGGYGGAGSFLGDAAAADSNAGGGNGGSKTPSPALIALLAINGVLVVGLIVLAVLYFRKRSAAARGNRQRQLYTSVSVSGDPIFVAPREKQDYDEEASGSGPRDDTPLTHGLSHGPYYDPHEPGSRPASRLR
ncbi:hypothetical protein DFH07DRAFT_911954 [Mycena maculata]|uniref:Cupin type-1 domain-containing protein n=1 Tax=Mycena maculata TaxID=230809 RepID=A0AAD7K410_9AGAR|nr:hypothetical protein DFH07DRAFT_911954 [Mycena maculata]